MKLIITVPHGKCIPGTKERTCDTSALYMGKQLEMKAKEAGINTVLLESNVFRKDMDLNRYKSRKTSFRPQLTKKLKEAMCKGEEVLVMDIHSFPVIDVVGLSFGEAVEVIMQRKESSFGDNQIVFLDLNKEMSKETRTIANSIKGYKIGMYQGDLENDILLEAKTFKAHGVLMEVSEALTKIQLSDIASQIVQGFKNMTSCTIL